MGDKDDEVEVEPLELPDIPDYPEAPLTAWKHYGITNFASQKIVEELEKVQYSGYMVGLEVAYSQEEEEKNYAISFGKVQLTEAEPNDQEQKPDLPISEEFLARLFKTVSDYMAANVPDGSRIDPELTFVISGSLYSYKTKCRRPELCDRGHRGRRYCYSLNGGLWTCLHGAC